MQAKEYFTYGMALLKVNPPHITDQAIVAQMKRIGLDMGAHFNFDALEPMVKQALAQAPADGIKVMKAKVPTLARIVNGWQMNTDTMGV